MVFVACNRTAPSESGLDPYVVKRLQKLHYALRTAQGESDIFPSSFQDSSPYVEDLSIFAMTGHDRGGGMVATNVNEWTDLVYFGNQMDVTDHRVALVVSPPQNHDGAFGDGLFQTGSVKKFVADMIDKIIDDTLASRDQT